MLALVTLLPHHLRMTFLHAALRLAAAILVPVILSPPAFAQAMDPASEAGDAPHRDELLVLAASSLTSVFEAVGRQYRQETGQPVKFSFAASAALARQVEAGLRADIFASADAEWMDYLYERKLINGASRRTIARNRLVLVAPASSSVQLRIAPGFPLVAALAGGRLATGDPDYVPVGRYARAALTRLGSWDEVAPHLARAENVRAALAFVARGEAPLGIVYATDARDEKRIRVVDVFTESLHPPILYPAAATTVARPAAKRFLAFLSGPKGQALLREHGFIAPPL
jgi:molybdate transport system substrate-binding protein